MTESAPLYFSDFCLESGVEVCHFCGAIAECRLIHVDEPGHRQPVCEECIEQMEAQG